MGEYATWTGFWTGVSVIHGLGLGGLNHFTGKSFSPVAVADLVKTCSPGSGGYGEAKYRRLIGNKWVFKIKRDGTFRARLVALGYSQIPGVDYTDNFAPVAHDVSFRIALARMMVEKLDSLVVDVETAFLYGDIEEEIFMKSPVAMEEIDPGSSPEDCYQLRKGIYGLCQAARQFWKKFVDTIKKEPFGFTVSPAD